MKKSTISIRRVYTYFPLFYALGLVIFRRFYEVDITEVMESIPLSSQIYIIIVFITGAIVLSIYSYWWGRCDGETKSALPLAHSSYLDLMAPAARTACGILGESCDKKKEDDSCKRCQIKDNWMKKRGA